MADKKKEKLEHIQVKDNGIKLSHKIGDTLGDSKQTIQNEIINSLLIGRNETNLTRYKITQNNQLRDFKTKTNKLINQTKKAVKTAFKSDTTVNLTDKQIKNMTSQIDKGLLFLEQSAIQQYQNTIRSVVLKCKTAGDLKDQLQKHIESGVNVGVVYKDNKEFKFDNYWEMKTRTDIQQDIGKNMVDTGSALGVIFYIAAYFGDCAKDHVDYQGKIYVDKDWKSNAPKDRVNEIQDYIDSKSIKTVQEVMDAPAYFTTRPNCRHYFQYIDIDSVLGAKNKDDVDKLRDERNLNYNGKYKPEKYKALQEQRLNERRIRYKKEEIQKQEQLLALNPGDKAIQSRIMAGESMVRKYQADQRELIKQYDNLERQYNRENLSNRVSFGVSKNLTNENDNGNINIDIDEYTPCLKKADGTYVDTILKKSKPVKIEDMTFDWKKKSHPDDELFLLYAKGDKRIQGAMFVRECKDDHSIRVDLVENAKHNREGKEYTGVGAHLFAEAVKQSYEKGYDGDVTFTSKTRLKKYYQEKLGAINIINNEMLITGEASKKLFERYYGEKNGKK